MFIIIITGYTIRLRTTTTENINHFPEVKNNVAWNKLICHIFATTTENIDHFPEVKNNVVWNKLICQIFTTPPFLFEPEGTGTN